MTPKKIKTQYCFNCGEPIGVGAYYDRFSTCGAISCDAEAREAEREEHAMAQLEKFARDRGC